MTRSKCIVLKQYPVVCIIYIHSHQVVDEWWKIWMNNFVPNLQIRSKWFKKRGNIKIGDIVLNMDRNVSGSNWQMAVVVETYR